MAEVLIDSYPTSNSNGTDSEAISGYSGYYQGLGQSFEASSSAPITRVQWYLKKVSNSPTGTGVAKLYAHSGNYGNSSPGAGSVPGTLLATSGTLDVSTLTNSFALYDFTFTGAQQYDLISGIRYVVTFEYSGGNDIDYVDIGVDYSTPTHPGNDPFLFGGVWSPETDDAIFYVYGDTGAFTTGVGGKPGNYGRYLRVGTGMSRSEGAS